MTIDEAIRHCEEVAAKYDRQCEYGISKEGKEYNSQCAAEQRQLAEWLTDYKELKAADVQPIRHGKWLPSDSYITTAYGTLHCEKCSECGAEVIEGDDYDNDFCPCCGARMDGEQNG